MDIIEKYHSDKNCSTIPNNYLFDILKEIYEWANDNNTTIHKIRNEQQKFRDEIIERDTKCIISNTISTECQACHIIPVEDGGNYNINNGLLLNACLHITFDKYLWTINPVTLKVVLSKNNRAIVGTIYDYNDKKINIVPNEYITYNLQQRWLKFIEINQKN